MKNLEEQIRENQNEMNIIIERVNPQSSPNLGGGPFDNRPSWDNIGPSFDNRPTWDNWSKRW